MQYLIVLKCAEKLQIPRHDETSCRGTLNSINSRVGILNHQPLLLSSHVSLVDYVFE